MQHEKTITVVPTKSDSDVIFCLQSLSKTLTCRGKICIEYSDVTNYNCNRRGLLTIKGNPAFRQVNKREYW